MPPNAAAPGRETRGEDMSTRSNVTSDDTAFDHLDDKPQPRGWVWDSHLGRKVPVNGASDPVWEQLAKGKVKSCDIASYLDEWDRTRTAAEHHRTRAMWEAIPTSDTACPAVETAAVAECRADGRPLTEMGRLLRLARLAEQGHTGGRDAAEEWAAQWRGLARDQQRAIDYALSYIERDGLTPEEDKGCCAPPPVNLEVIRKEPPVPITLAQAHKVFRRWLGDTYDLDGLNAVLGALAAERLDGDPLWLLLLSGSGNAKTETVQAAAGAGAIVTSTISSEGALLSATAAKEKAKNATGGLLRKFGSAARGVLVIKDVTSILSMNRDLRASVLAALREVYDGSWSRNVGTDGGRTLDWKGRLVVIGAVTTAWDRAHDVIAAMGDRFVVVRMDSAVGRLAAGRKAIGNTGSEAQMRAELAEATAGVVAGVDPENSPTLDDDETNRLLAAADLVTLARTGVDHDYRGDVIDAHAPEMPTRFAKQLAQLMRGGIALGMDRTAALNLALRAAGDSMPPLRLAIIRDVAAHPNARTSDVRKRLGKPRATVDRQLQALNMLGVLDVTEEEDAQGRSVWRYSPADGTDLSALDPE